MTEVLKAFNKYLETRRIGEGINCHSFIVEVKDIKPSAIKAYKAATVTLYVIQQSEIPIPLMKVSKTYNSTVKDYDKVYSELKEELLCNLFTFTNTFEFKKLLAGNYEGMEG